MYISANSIHAVADFQRATGKGFVSGVNVSRALTDHTVIECLVRCTSFMGCIGVHVTDMCPSCPHIACDILTANLSEAIQVSSMPGVTLYTKGTKMVIVWLGLVWNGFDWVVLSCSI